MTIRTLTLLSLLVLLTACGGAREPGVEVDGERLAVVDVHMHTGTWDGSPPGFQARLSERVPTGFKWTMKIFTDW